MEGKNNKQVFRSENLLKSEKCLILYPWRFSRIPKFFYSTIKFQTRNEISGASSMLQALHLKIFVYVRREDMLLVRQHSVTTISVLNISTTWHVLSNRFWSLFSFNNNECFVKRRKCWILFGGKILIGINREHLRINYFTS